ncbi:MAG: ABC transporter ATP-binding protein [Clostridium sulfidigenes]|uniref:ABC transporter ATP-binding protein n=1 Tax=Clostridium sulfidigenes TaxID=318464 RepID=A0A927ZN42_9CLOT|nr:ABC transporter ATP-binding protein [Clostridium sulfidigenes]HAR85704.1 ABC transporter ATP-binding protein [Clostridium sp.]
MLTIINLEKFYGKYKAVNGLDMHLKKGDIFGFIGPNGAGKSTTMKIIAGLLPADGGEIYVDGIDALKDNKKLKEKIGYMPDFFGSYENLKVIEYMEFYASIYGIVGKESKDLIMDLLELVNLEEKKDAYVDGLSRGMKQRLCLARSLVHNPELLILDEPASGMDPRSRFEMKGILKNLKDMDKTVIISSHILSEMNEICTSVGIIEEGNLIYSGSINNLLSRMSSNNPLKIIVRDKVEESKVILSELPYITNIKENSKELTVFFNGGEIEISNTIKALVLKDIPIISFTQVSENLEDVFIKITEKESK